ncbi:MAG: potassium channel family protein [Acidimicrobiales bacterium]
MATTGHPIDRIRMPRATQAPLQAVLRRVGFALGLVVFVALVVRIGRGGYVDVTGDEISFLDALYYASVTVTTTGYGDITAVSSGARLATVILITPARILFLILVVGTTVEVLTDQTRQHLMTKRWRQRVNDHIVICGFGATGLSAANELISRGARRDEIAVVDTDDAVIQEARRRGYVAIHGDATKNEVLVQAAVDRARAVVVTPNRDDTAVLVTLTVREMNPKGHIVAGGREQENLHLLRQGGADEVIDSTAAVGRMLGLATLSPGAVGVLDDLIDSSSGLELVELAPTAVDGDVRVPDGATLVGAFRDGRRIPIAQLDVNQLRPDDRLVVLRDTGDGR